MSSLLSKSVAVRMVQLADFFESKRFELVFYGQVQPFYPSIGGDAQAKVTKDLFFQMNQGYDRTEGLTLELHQSGNWKSIDKKLIALEWAKTLRATVAELSPGVVVSKSDSKFKVSRGMSVLDAFLSTFNYQQMRECFRQVTDATPPYKNPHFYLTNMMDSIGRYAGCMETIAKGTGITALDSFIDSLSCPDYYTNGYPCDLLLHPKLDYKQGIAIAVHAKTDYCSASVETEAFNPSKVDGLYPRSVKLPYYSEKKAA